MIIAIEQSTYVITASFTDETGAAVVPNSVTWTLVNGDGQVVNSRSAVSVTPASSVTIVLSGDDLDLGTDLDAVDAGIFFNKFGIRQQDFQFFNAPFHKGLLIFGGF